MEFSFPNWLFNPLATTFILGLFGYLFREALAKFFTSSIEHRFDRKLEDVKAELRAKETELDHITSFLSTQKRERDALIQAKRIEAAEITLRACNTFAKLSMAVEFMKILNIEKILERTAESNIHGFLNTIMVSMKVDEILAEIAIINETLPRLYLSDRALDLFNAYKTIVLHATMVIKALSQSVHYEGLLKNGSLQKIVEAVVPTSKEGFEQHGEGYAYYWAQYFYDETLKSLRSEVNGIEKDQEDAATITRLTIASQQAQIEVRQELKSAGLPSELYTAEKDVPELPH